MAKPLYHHRSKRSEKFAVFTVFSALAEQFFLISFVRSLAFRSRFCISSLNKYICIHIHYTLFTYKLSAQPKWFFVHVLSPGEFKPRKFLIRTCGTNSLYVFRSLAHSSYFHQSSMYSKSQHANSCFAIQFPFRKFH